MGEIPPATRRCWPGPPAERQAGIDDSNTAAVASCAQVNERPLWLDPPL